GRGMDELPDDDDLAVDQEGRLDHGAQAPARPERATDLATPGQATRSRGATAMATPVATTRSSAASGSGRGRTVIRCAPLVSLRRYERSEPTQAGPPVANRSRGASQCSVGTATVSSLPVPMRTSGLGRPWESDPPG